jgi:hypothetical protein
MSVVIGGVEVVVGGWASSEVDLRAQLPTRDYYAGREYVSANDVIESLCQGGAAEMPVDNLLDTALAPLEQSTENGRDPDWWSDTNRVVIIERDTVVGGADSQLQHATGLIEIRAGVENTEISTARAEYLHTHSKAVGLDYVSTANIAQLRELEKQCLPCAAALERYRIAVTNAVDQATSAHPSKSS